MIATFSAPSTPPHECVQRAGTTSARTPPARGHTQRTPNGNSTCACAGLTFAAKSASTKPEVLHGMNAVLWFMAQLCGQRGTMPGPPF